MRLRKIKLLLILLVWLLAVAVAFTIAWFQFPPPVPPPPPTPVVQHTPVPTPPTRVCVNPLIPYGKLPPETRYSTVQDHMQQPFLWWNGKEYLKVPGGVGRLWGIREGTETEVLLYAPLSKYCPM